jgi:hypothetical protein
MVSGDAETQSAGEIRLSRYGDCTDRSHLCSASVVAFSDFATRAAAAFYGFITIIV